jgi:DNA-binding MarR family transcriptional regulator
LVTESKLRSELDVLAAVEDGVVITQAALTKRIGVSIGLINALLKRAMMKGYVKTRQAPYKRYAYYLTPKGFAEKSRLVAEYLDYSLRFFRKARGEYADLMAAARKHGKSRLVLLGGGDLAEIAVLAAWSEDANVIGIFDPQANESRRFGLEVLRSVEELERCDAVVITDAISPQQSFDRMCAVLSASRVLAPPFLKITREQSELPGDQEVLGDSA